ncbi:MAG: Methyltransferase type 11 [Parcubacteria group bacterium GW2011_GWA2_42_11]|nr:MAG: Methyltransferase type 11 [Parcubacteria group bacterium GW2011_GWA2_42_11]
MQGTGGFINPEKVLEQLDIKNGMAIADFGCGHGYFAIPAGKIVGPDGKIFAIDVLNEALESTRSQAQLESILNIETKRGNLEVVGGSKIPDGSVEMVLLHNVLFESQKKAEIIREAKRVLKPGGTFVLIDWLTEKNNIGPQEGWRINEEDAKKLAVAEGFAYQKNFDAGEYHYGLLFNKA